MVNDLKHVIQHAFTQFPRYRAETLQALDCRCTLQLDVTDRERVNISTVSHVAQK